MVFRITADEATGYVVDTYLCSGWFPKFVDGRCGKHVHVPLWWLVPYVCRGWMSPSRGNRFMRPYCKGISTVADNISGGASSGEWTAKREYLPWN